MDKILVTIIDLLEVALDGDLSSEAVLKLSPSQVAEMCDSVNRFYDAWVPPDRDPNLLRVHLGGWVARIAYHGMSRDLLHTALLYAHEAVVHDPVAAFFDTRRLQLRALDPVEGMGMKLLSNAVHVESTGGYFRKDALHQDLLEELGEAVERLGRLRSLVRLGVVIPIPHFRLTLPRQESIFSAVRHMLRDDAFRAAVDVPIDFPPLSQDEGPPIRLDVPLKRKQDQLLSKYGDEAYYLARTLALASAVDASYLPPSATEWNIFKQRLDATKSFLSHSTEMELVVAPALVASRLPFLTGVPTDSVARVRRDTDAFEDWRRTLRRATRQIRSLPSSGDEFVADARSVLDDELTPMAEAVRASTRKSKYLGSAQSASITLASGVSGALTTALATGEPVAGIPGLAVGGALEWAIRVLFSARPRDAASVIAHLRHDPSTQADDWPKREWMTVSPK